MLARNARFVIYVAAGNDTLPSLAHAFLGDAGRDWIIAEFNGITHLSPGQAVIIPLQPHALARIHADGYQTVPILVYHRFGPKADKMVVTPDAFAAQLDYLARNDYRVVRLSDLKGFLEGKQALPKRSVIITIDDGYASNHRYAYPLLKRHGFPATIFLYTDFVGAGDALNWAQMKEMLASGLIDIQTHSKTHANLSERLPGENEAEYRKRLDSEILIPRDLLRRKLAVAPISYAYPYGEANEVVAERVGKAGYSLAVTVNPGGNPRFAYPFMLRRTMIYGDHDLEAFKARLQVFAPVDLR